LCDNSTTKLPSFQLATKSNHRLRFINIGAYAWFGVSLDQHALAITEVDGTNVLPSYQKQLYISPGQRYSAIITTNQTMDDVFWLRARMVTNCFSNPELPGGADEVRAVVQYSKTSSARPLSALISQPASRNWDIGFAVQCIDMDHTEFVPVPAVPAPATADHSYFIRSNIEIGDWRLQRGFFNRSTFRPDLKSPSLHRTLETLRFQNETLTRTDDGLNDASFNLKDGLILQHKGVKVVDLIIQNFDEGNHPMHLHGHKFWVLGQAHGYFPGYGNLSLDFSNPLRRDTATLEG
jgi:FtsP/CotA-like multicopper oxidase with cupredoxin domain